MDFCSSIGVIALEEIVPIVSFPGNVGAAIQSGRLATNYMNHDELQERTAAGLVAENCC